MYMILKHERSTSQKRKEDGEKDTHSILGAMLNVRHRRRLELA